MIPEDEVYTRLAHRMICANCGAAHNTDLHWDITTCTACGWSLYRRNDDADLNAIKNRVSAYYQDTVPALAWIKEQWHLVQIDGTQSIEKIFAEILSIIS
jgi:adenylate kinase